MVLKSSLQKQWNYILNALKKFTYFEDWNEIAKRECCIYSKIKNYKKGDVIYKQGTMATNFAFFVLKGTCICIQELDVIEKKINGIKHFKLFNYDKYKELILEEREKKKIRGTEVNLISSPSLTKTLSKAKPTESKDIRKSSRIMDKDSVKISVLNEEQKRSLTKTKVESKYQQEKKKEVVLDSMMFMHNEEEVVFPDYVKKIFMQVCLFNELGAFGMGENLHNRIIVADNDVECLLIPNFWIWSKNKGNVFTRIQIYLNRHIPTEKEVFRIFLENRKWGIYKRKLVNHIRRKRPQNYINNVPYSIRISEDIAYGIKYC